MSGDARAFTYRSIVPSLWALVGVAAVELTVTHLVLAHWTVIGAVLLSILSAGLIGWLVLGIASMRHLPVLIGNHDLVMRAGRIKGARVPIAQIRGLRTDWGGDELKQRTVLNCALLSYPNVLVELTEPLRDRRGTLAVAHRLDDPAGFALALEAVRSARDR